MIKGFKPLDFEECLMGLPIQNWRLVNEEHFEDDNDYKEIMRPKMMVTHLEALKGISFDGQHRIKAFTDIEALKDDLPLGFSEVIKKSYEVNEKYDKEIGLHLINIKDDRYIMTYLVALNSTIVMKSYMQEREVVMSEYKQSTHNLLYRYNEIPYEILIEDVHFDDYVVGESFLKYSNDAVSFRYFMGFSVIDETIITFRFAIALPTGKIVRSEAFEALLRDQHVDLDSHVKNEIRKLGFKIVKSLRLNVHGNHVVEKFFEDILWPLLDEISEGRQYDQKR